MDVARTERRVNDTAEALAERAAATNGRSRREAEMIANYHGKRRRDNHREWCEFHRHLAGVHERLAEHHRQALGRLIDGGRPPGGMA